MRIGIDIDNVIANFDDTLLEEYLEHDKKLRNTGIINENPEYLRNGMFDWTKEEEEDFYINNIERIAKKLKPLDNASYYINKLKEDGNEIYIVSGRDNGEYTDPYQLTEEWLKKNNIYYDKLILTDAYDKHSKTEVCINNDINLMIEDSVKISLDLINNGIKVYTMDTRYNKYEKNLDRVFGWNEVYMKICLMN